VVPRARGVTRRGGGRRNTATPLGGAVDAARARASLGEISDAVEKVSGRFQAVIHTISGVYSSEFTDKTELERAREMADEFEDLTGRRPRIFVAKMGQDGHDRGQKVIASSFADMGWDVDVGPLFQTPAETAQDAVDNDVHMVGFSSLAAGHNTLLPQLVDELKKLGRDDIMVCIGGVIPVQDYDNLYEHGAVAIFAPGTNIPEAGIKLLTLLIARAKEEAAREKEMERLRRQVEKQQEKEEAARQRAAERRTRQVENVLGSVLRTAGREITRSIFGTRKR